VDSRVVACAGGGAVRLETRPRPRPGPGELLLELRCAGLCGTDLWKLESDTAPAGAVLGHEVVGVVAELGPGTHGFATGDRVVTPHHVACGECAQCRRGSDTSCAAFREAQLDPGGFADWFLVRPRAVRTAARRLPAGLADETAVFLEPAACVLRGVRRSGLAIGGVGGPAPECAAVLGAGSMGLLHVLLLRALDPRLRLLVSEPRPERRELALRLGADRAAAPGEATAAAARELSAGAGADAVFDCVGGAAAAAAGLELTRDGGTTVLFAHAPAGAAAGFELNRLFKHERRILGTYSGGLAEQQEVWELLASGRLDPSALITHRLPLARFSEGLELARARRALKVVFVPDAASP
jgi:L-iditol 2-dehydrogenase